MSVQVNEISKTEQAHATQHTEETEHRQPHPHAPSGTTTFLTSNTIYESGLFLNFT
jgi:hypothetical protein